MHISLFLGTKPWPRCPFLHLSPEKSTSVSCTDSCFLTKMGTDQVKLYPFRQRPSMYLVRISKPVVLRLEEEAIWLSIFHHCLCAFHCCCRSFDRSLCRLFLFLLPHVAVSRPCCLLKFTLPGPLDWAYSIFSKRRMVLIKTSQYLPCKWASYPQNVKCVQEKIMRQVPCLALGTCEFHQSYF